MQSPENQVKQGAGEDDIFCISTKELKYSTNIKPIFVHCMTPLLHTLMDEFPEYYVLGTKTRKKEQERATIKQP
jgi:hypothetical protein